MDSIDKVVQHIIKARYEDLTIDVVEATKRLILDGLAVALGGSGKEGVTELLAHLADMGGKQESTAWMFGNKLPAAAAVQVNAMMMHALDYDDVYDKAVLHCGVVSIPVAFAMAERIGGVSGKDFITAIALGADLCARLSLAVTISVFELGWHYTTLHGNFSAAAVAGKLLKLDDDGMVNAFGIAYHQAGGNYQALHDGTLSKRIGPAFACRDGITAALLAQRGITGPKNIIDGKAGLYRVYHRGHYDPNILLKDLGVFYEVGNLSLKPYPCCRGTHPSIDGALQLVKSNDLRPENIAKVSVKVGKGIYYLVCDPVSAKQNPKTLVDAQFSIPWTVAWALTFGKVDLAAFTQESIKNPDVLALSNKVVPETDDSLQSIGLSPAVITVTTRDSRTFTQRIDIPYGSPGNPMSMETIKDKMVDCAGISVKNLNKQRVEDIFNMISSLENVKDVTEITALLT